MVLGSQTTEARFDSAFIGERRDAQGTVEVACDLYAMEGLVESVEEVAGHDEDVDAPAVSRIARSAGLRAGFACTNGDAIVDALDNGGDVLMRMLLMTVYLELRNTALIELRREWTRYSRLGGQPNRRKREATT